ncbi:hypothetical protein QBC42DRAFT_175819 [Cladorrhinum samala]|uniref:Autophagy-related protein 101 n=1 Tax=Cladorrhinum samala TaxID=585594 RepID=A0AAV9HSF6_9PEZI|nr:hypothetical protein QBC42DRAFT_175819 [Cladorrhinum samala]
MEQRDAPEFIIEAFADPNSVRDVVRAILHTIFFLRYFPAILPQTRDFLGVEVAYVPDDQIETLIDQRATALVRQLDAERHQNSRNAGSYNSGSRGQITVQFLEKRRKKTWLPIRAGDDEIPWESWTIKVTVSEPRTEGERIKVRKATESTLQNAVMKALTLANSHKDHIPPITTTETNPFPYQIYVGGVPRSHNAASQHQGQRHNQQSQMQTEQPSTLASAAGGWASRMGIY